MRCQPRSLGLPPGNHSSSERGTGDSDGRQAPCLFQVPGEYWWRVGKALTADPDLYVTGTTTISAETSLRVCQALGLSTTLSKVKGRPNGETAVRQAIDTFNRFPDQDAAKKAIEEAGTYHNLSKGTSFGSRLAKSMSVPVSLLDHIREETGLEDRKARQYIARYLKDTDVQEEIVAFIEQSL